MYMHVYACICTYSCVYSHTCVRTRSPDGSQVPNLVNSVVPPPVDRAKTASPFNHSEFEIFSHHTTSATRSSDAQGDRMLECATNQKFRADRVRFSKMKTMGKTAVKLNIPAGVMQRDFTEKADGCQRLVFFFQSIYDAIKELLLASLLRNKQYTEFEMCYSAGLARKRQYGSINSG